jgi:hypothetical protein
VRIEKREQTWNKEQGTKIKEQGTRNKELRARNKEQGTRSKEQGTRSKEQGTRSKEQRELNKNQCYYFKKNDSTSNKLYFFRLSVLQRSGALSFFFVPLRQSQCSFFE